MKSFLESRLKVTVNQKKTRVGYPLRLKFLGFLLEAGRGGPMHDRQQNPR
ncbi:MULTISPECIES: hypothetical protein [Pediococcus]|nr:MULTISPECIES: hypothetical protein [Pediococcus]